MKTTAYPQPTIAKLNESELALKLFDRRASSEHEERSRREADNCG